MKNQPKDINELTEQMCEAFAMVKDDPRRANQVKEITNAAGKIINGMKLLLVYAALRGEEPEIPFLGKTSGRPLKPGAKLLTAG